MKRIQSFSLQLPKLKVCPLLKDRDFGLDDFWRFLRKVVAQIQDQNAVLKRILVVT